ncbi:MAG: OmpA family protein [Myxococcales bacterium]|nr:OmpA family protein [Myxococcales bacterium]
MGRIPSLVASSLGFLLAPAAALAQPALPEGDAEPAAPADAAPTEAAPDGADPASTDAGADASLSASGSLDADLGAAGLLGETDDESPTRGRDEAEGDAAGGDDGDPTMVRGRREPMMNTNRGGAGLFTTTLPDVGGKYTFRFKLHTDFFRREGFIYEGQAGPDQHARVRGGVALAFSPFEWGELFLSINSQANRNSREQPGRQDAEAIFALGDVDFGIKGAYRFKKTGIGVGGQVGVGLLSGSERLLTSGANVWFDGLFAVDVRYLTKKHFPFRFTTNLGWIYDSSLNIAPFGRISDDVSREVVRFSLGANHNRLRMRYAVDFPVRLGKERQFGIDPILEWSWDVSTQEESIAFGRDDAVASPLPRSSQWLTLGLRANVVSGLHLEAAADIGMVSPNFEFGPPVPPWQILLGLGWSFDPNPVIKEVEVQAETPPPPPEPKTVLEGRIVGQVVDPSGTPIPDARVSFPGLTTTAVLTDANGAFTSFRFPAGQVAVQVVVNGTVVSEQSAQIADGEDTNLTIQLDAAPAPPTGIVRGAVTGPSGEEVEFTMRIVGQGVDQVFNSTGNLIALELYVGDYSGTINAPGFKSKDVRFTVSEGGEIQLSEQLEADKPPATPLVKASSKGIRLRGGIKYNGDDLSSRSHEALDQLAVFLNGHPEYQSIRISVHTDDHGNPKARSQSRADAVKSYLVGKGVSPARIEAKGYGDSKPVAVNLTAAGRAKNNRTNISVTKFGG